MTKQLIHQCVAKLCEFNSIHSADEDATQWIRNRVELRRQICSDSSRLNSTVESRRRWRYFGYFGIGIIHRSVRCYGCYLAVIWLFILGTFLVGTCILHDVSLRRFRLWSSLYLSMVVLGIKLHEMAESEPLTKSKHKLSCWDWLLGYYGLMNV